ncbi:MAG: restriction endonuclease [Candidatus Heimdallarchaeota archaeon]
MSTDNDDGNDLYQLAYSFFKEMGFEIKEQITLIGTSGKRYQFDMAIKTNLDDLEINEVLVKIINWKRAVGVDRLIRLERILNDLQNRKGLVISNSFSEPAIKFAKKHGLITYQRKHLHPLSDYK